MLAEWQYIAIFVIIAPLIPGSAVAANWLLSPKKPNRIKQETYECGVQTVGTSWIQFKVQYYIYALVFVVFDIEAVFLFPIAAAYGLLGAFAVFEIVLFVLILAAALAYTWGDGSLEWA